MIAAASQGPLRGIAVVDVGYTNTKVLLYDRELNCVAERRTASFHRDGLHYREIDVDPVIQFAATTLRELDAVLPIDKISVSAHGACIACLRPDGTLAVPLMDYMSEPPPEIERAYHAQMPDYAEGYTPPLPRALLHGLQLFWQQHVYPAVFAAADRILPLMQYVAHALGGRAVSEVSSMSCQSHLVDMRDGKPSSLARRLGWDRLYAPEAKAWQVIGALKPEWRGTNFRGYGEILGGVHDSNANFLRYLAGGQNHFTLLSTGTWIIGFDTDADITGLDPARDIVANKSVFGKTIACCRFFGGKEFEVLAQGAAGVAASMISVEDLVAKEVMALPSFTDSGGPMPATGLRGRIAGPFAESATNRASLASLYCALMVSESLHAIRSYGNIIVDGPFSQNDVFLSVLAALRPHQQVLASQARDGTAQGAACLALMVEGKLPNIAIPMRIAEAAEVPGLKAYQQAWRRRAKENADA
jgi:sugar (pentulose or hexulose) kinase